MRLTGCHSHTLRVNGGCLRPGKSARNRGGTREKHDAAWTLLLLERGHSLRRPPYAAGERLDAAVGGTLRYENSREKRAVGGGSSRLCRMEGGGESPLLLDRMAEQGTNVLQVVDAGQ